MQLVKSSAAMSDGEIEFLGEVTKTRRRNRAGSSRGTLSERLLAISREELKEVEEDPGQPATQGGPAEDGAGGEGRATASGRRRQRPHLCATFV